MFQLKSTLECAIKESGKNIEDIKFVSYYVGNNLQTRQLVYCPYDEFINVFGEYNIYDLNWFWDMKFVADDWWLYFDSRGEWILNELPKKPNKYREPKLNLLKPNLIDFEV